MRAPLNSTVDHDGWRAEHVEVDMRKAATAVVLMVGLAILADGHGFAQGAKSNPDIDKMQAAFAAAWAKGDAKGVSGHYTPDTLRLGADGKVSSGRAAVEQYFASVLSGSSKGSTIALRQQTTNTVTPDVMVVHGTFEVKGAGARTGHYVNTVVNKNGQWLIAASAVVQDPAAPR